MKFEDTLGNIAWLKENEHFIKALVPETFTHIHNLNALQIGFQLKLRGLDWRSENDFGKIMVALVKVGLILQDGFLVKRNPDNLFSGE
jgi:hypothetical protein